jgi:2,4-didehydro-3-deoxy-L-rhamnonate hydrolase
MKLYTFEVDGQHHLGAEVNGKLADLSAVAMSMSELILKSQTGLAGTRSKLSSAKTYAMNEVTLKAPLPRPGKMLCSGVNYAGHARENPNAKMPTEPFFFSKLSSAIIGPGEAIKRGATEQLDYEVEFAVVISKALARGTSDAATIMDAIFGYTLVHDVSARDVQFKDNQITLGKNFDTYAPMGPCIVTKDELPDPDNVKLRTTLNGVVVQDGTTADWLFNLPALLGHILKFMTLEPCDIVTTGTPAGVGFFRQPQLFMKPGDVVVIEAEGIGRLENPVIA